MPTRLPVRHGHETFVVELRQHGELAIDDRDVVTVAEAGDGRYRVTRSGEVTDVVVTVAGDTVWVGIDGEVFACQVGDAARAASAARDADALMPPMPATVTRVAVAPGQSVLRGDLLVALEAMKMELPIVAPHDGVVRAVRCQEGDLVQPGTILVEI